MGRYVLDASDLAFTDSIGLEVLLEASEQLTKCGRSFKICQANETLKEVIELTGLSESNVGVILHRTVQALRSKW